MFISGGQCSLYNRMLCSTVNGSKEHWSIEKTLISNKSIMVENVSRQLSFFNKTEYIIQDWTTGEYVEIVCRIERDVCDRDTKKRIQMVKADSICSPYCTL